MSQKQKPHNMKTTVATTQQPPQSIPKTSALAVMAGRLHIDPQKLHETLKNTVFKEANDHELVALVLVANEYGLNPLVKQIYAFKGSGGAIIPVVGIDGWLKIINARDEFDGLATRDIIENGNLIAVECTIHRKDRRHPTIVTEWLSECQRATDPWKSHPHRMLRHKAIIQAGRIAFGITGLSDEDDAHAVRHVSGSVVEISGNSMVPNLNLAEPEKDLFGEPVKELPTPEQRLDELAEAIRMEKKEIIALAAKSKVDIDDRAAVIAWAEAQL